MGLPDEDIIGSNMTMPTTYIPKVQPFYMRLIIDAFDELVLHHKVYIFIFRITYMDQEKVWLHMESMEG